MLMHYKNNVVYNGAKISIIIDIKGKQDYMDYTISI